MHSSQAWHIRAAHHSLPRGTSLPALSMTGVKRRLASFSPLLGTVLLTAAIFLLPATGDGRQARAAIDDIKLSATHIQYHAAVMRPTAQE